jgi:hypothetical protein
MFPLMLGAAALTLGHCLPTPAVPAPNPPAVVRHDDEQHITALAAALYIAQHAYGQATASPNPAARLDDMCDAMAEPWDDALPNLPKFAGKNLEFAEVMRAAAADRMWAFTVVEHARAEAGDGYGWVFDALADGLKRGADPQTVRADTRRVVERIRIDTAITAAVDTITTTVTTALAGLTTNPRDVAERLHHAVDDAQAEHLARVGDMPYDTAVKSEAFSTATEAVTRALELSADRKGTAEALRCMLDMVIREAGVR